MSQRLILKNSRVCGKTTKSDLALASLGLRGSTPNDDGTDGEGGSEGGSGTGDGDGDGSGSEDRGGNGGGSGDDKDGNDGESVETIRKRMQAADRRAAEAERRLKEIEEKDLSEQQKKDRELEDLRSYREQSESEIASLSLQVSFLSVNDVQWHDPSIALSQVDLESIKGEDGKVDKKALKREIERLQKEKPYLVKDTGTGGDAGGGAGGGKGQGSSGAGVGSGTGGKKGGGLSEEELRRRYPSLNV